MEDSARRWRGGMAGSAAGLADGLLTTAFGQWVSRRRCGRSTRNWRPRRSSRKPASLHDLDLGQVLGIDEADRFAIGVYDEEIVNAVFGEYFDSLGGEGGLGDANGIAGHHLPERLGKELIIFRDAAAEIAVGENTDQAAPGVDDGEAAGLGAGHDDERVTDGDIIAGDGVALAGAHDVGDLGEHGTADGAGRVMAGVILLLETAGLENGHGECVAHDESGGGAGGGGEVERTGFARDADIEHEIAELRERCLRAAGDGNDFDREPRDRWHQVDEFLGFTGIAEGKNEVAVVQDAEVAVEGIDAIEDDAGGT